MKLGKLGALVVALAVVANALVSVPSFASDKRRILVWPFEYGAVESSVGAVDVGKGIVSLLITRLVKDGTYSVIETQMLDAILKEQNLSVSDRADPATACKIGKLLGADAAVVGTVTQFGVEKRSSSISLPTGYIPYVGGLGSLGTFRSHKAKAKVGIDARLIDLNTREILGACNGTAEQKTGGNWTMNDSWDWSSTDFASSVAGEATIAACDQVVQQLRDLAGKIPDNQSLAAANVQGKIADVTGNTVIINVGKSNGLHSGDNLQAERITKTVKDPATGKVLKEISTTIGIINLTSVDPDSSTGTITHGAGLRVGDNVRKVTTDVSAVVITPLPDRTTSTTPACQPPAKPTTTVTTNKPATKSKTN